MSSAVATKRKASYVRRAELDDVLERIADLEDAMHIKKIEVRNEPKLPIELADRMIAGESPVRIWREHAGLSLNALAKKAKIPASYLSEIENGKKPGSVAAYRKLASVLGVTIDDLV